MAKQTFTTGAVLTAANMTSLQQTALGGGSTTAKTASYVLLVGDAGTVVQMSSGSATSITVNTSLFAAGDTVEIQNAGAGVCTITAGTATVSTSGSLALNQYEAGTLYFNSTSAAFFFGSNPGDITGVTAGTGISGGGTSGTVTVAIDSTVATLTGSQTLTNKTLTSPALTTPTISTLTTAGDLLVGTGSGAIARVAGGTSGYVLTSAGATSSPTWSAASTSSFVGVGLYHEASDISFANATTVALSWTAAEEQFDTSAFHTGTSSLITIPVGKAGYYLINGGCHFENNASNRRLVAFWKNGVETGTNLFTAEQTSGTTYYPSCYGSFVVLLAVADTIAMSVYQNSGGTIMGLKSIAQAIYLGA